MMPKTLIIYYSWANHTDKLAKIIQNINGGDLLRLSVAPNTFSNDMYETSEQAKKQIQSGKLPELVGLTADFTKYDLILIGGPVWSGSLATPILTLMKQLQKTTAKIAPFYTDAGTPGDYENDFKRVASNYKVVRGFGVDGSNLDHAQPAVLDWLQQLAK